MSKTLGSSNESSFFLVGDNQENLEPEDIKPSLRDLNRLKETFQEDLNNMKVEVGNIHVDVNVALLGFKDEVRQEISSVRDTLVGMIEEVNGKIRGLDVEVVRIRERTDGQDRIFREFEATIEASKNMVVQLRQLSNSAFERIRSGDGLRSDSSNSPVATDISPIWITVPDSTVDEGNGRYCRDRNWTVANESSNSVGSGTFPEEQKIPGQNSKGLKIDCPHCGATLCKQNLARHIRNKHVDPLRVDCPTCGQTYTKTGLQHHMKFKHPNPQRKDCEYCGKNLSAKYLGKHIMDVCKKSRAGK